MQEQYKQKSQRQRDMAHSTNATVTLLNNGHSHDDYSLVFDKESISYFNSDHLS